MAPARCGKGGGGGGGGAVNIVDGNCGLPLSVVRERTHFLQTGIRLPAAPLTGLQRRVLRQEKLLGDQLLQRASFIPPSHTACQRACVRACMSSVDILTGTF